MTAQVTSRESSPVFASIWGGTAISLLGLPMSQVVGKGHTVGLLES